MSDKLDGIKRIIGMFRVSACVPEVRPCDVPANKESICRSAKTAAERGSALCVFPELSVTGYTCADLFNDRLLLDVTDRAICEIAEYTRELGCAVVAGAPVRFSGDLYNCAVIMAEGHILGVVPKRYIPNYNEFYEKRWFRSGEGTDARRQMVKIGEYEAPFGVNQIFRINGVSVAAEICEDLWVPAPPSGNLCMAGAEVICNPSASDTLIGKRNYLLELLRGQSARCRCGYVYASSGCGESSTDLSFGGNAIIAEDGVIMSLSPEYPEIPAISTSDIDIDHLRHDRMHFSSFAEHFNGRDNYLFTDVVLTPVLNCDTDPLEYRSVDPTPFVDKDESRMYRRCDEISSIQAHGLATRLKAISCRNAVIGISGGLDSTLALLVTVRAFDLLGLDRKGIAGVTMPGFGTTHRTHSNARKMMEALGVTMLEIPIAAAVEQHFKDIGHDPNIKDITYENSQARERTQILMDLANQRNALVIGTGDLSELALGWCTYNGDQMSMYGVNASVPKTMVRYLVKGYARQTDNPELREILLDVVDTPISPELLPASDKGDILQVTEDVVGPYELHDFYLYQMLRYGSDPAKIYLLALKAFKDKYSPDIIYKWLRTFYKRFFAQQFKRSCMPDGIKVGSVCLSPRGDWRMPSDASARIWLDRIESLPNMLNIIDE